MSWTIWDGLVIALFLGQVGVIVWIILIARQIKNGPVATVLGRVRPLVASGKAIAVAGQQELGENRARWTAMLGEVQGLVAMLRDDKGAALREAMPINYQSIRGALSTARMLQGGWKQIKRVRNPMTSPPGPGKAAKRRPATIADRMGLIPPIVKRAAPLIRMAKVAIQVRKEMQQRTGGGA